MSFGEIYIFSRVILENWHERSKHEIKQNLTATKITLEGSRRHHTVADPERLPGGADQPHHGAT
jgi:hypothetical protein